MINKCKRRSSTSALEPRQHRTIHAAVAALQEYFVFIMTCSQSHAIQYYGAANVEQAAVTTRHYSDGLTACAIAHTARVD